MIKRKHAPPIPIAAKAPGSDPNWLRLLMEMPFVGVAIFNARSRRWKRVNDRFCAIVGYEREELARLSWPEISHPEDRERVGNELQQLVLRHSRHKQFKQRLVRKDGSIVQVDIDATDWQTPKDAGHTVVALVTESRPQDTDEILRAVIRQSIIGIYVIENGVFTFANPRMAGIFGYEAGEIAGKAVQQLVAEPNRALVLENIRKRIAGETENIQYEFRGLRKEGAIVEVRVHGSVANIKGQRALVGVVQDITEEKLSLSALSESEQRFRAMIENAPDLIITLDAQGVIAYASPSLADIGGYAPAEVVGRNFMDFTWPEDAAAAARTLVDVLQKPADPLRAELRWRHKDGSAIILESIAKNQLANQAIRAIVINARDITSRKRAELAVHESEERFRAVLEQSIAAMYVLQDDQIVYVNARMRDIFGYAPDEVFDPNPLAHVKESDWPKVIEEMRRRLSSESKAAYTITALRKDRSEFTLGVNATRAVYQGKPAIIAVAQDITEKARAENESRRYVERLEKAMQSTIEVVSRIGEIRDPYTHGHERRVGELAAAIGAEMGLDASAIEGMRVAGYVHDVGKIGVPAELLAKPTRLTATEFELIKDHARQSHEILKGIEFPWPVAQIALQHHERLDGSGYPNGLKGDAIIPEARLLSVADVVEAMASHRPYRAAVGIDKALAEIERGRGIVYDPIVVDACLRLFREKGYQLPA